MNKYHWNRGSIQLPSNRFIQMSFLRSKGGTAKDCFTTDERPSTPPEIRKFRRSTNLEPGRRFVHHGLADDFQEMALDKNVYGVMSDRGKNTAADLLSHNQPNELQRINMVKAEQVYKTATREQLGKTVDRKVILPSKFTQGILNIVHVVSQINLTKDIVQIMYPLVRAASQPQSQQRISYSPQCQRIQLKEKRFISAAMVAMGQDNKKIDITSGL